MESYFSVLSGVTGTVVGYTGGTTTDPTYTNLDGHTESIQITFDDSVISYQDLLDHFWRFRNHAYKYKTQYESAIFTHDDNQARLAAASKKAAEEKAGQTLYVRVEPAGPFYEAEEYHQDYYRKLRYGK